MTYLAIIIRALQQPMRSWLTGAVDPGGVDTLSVSEGVEEVGVATTATERLRSPATETTAPRMISSRPKDRCATTAVAEATSPATAP